MVATNRYSTVHDEKTEHQDSNPLKRYGTTQGSKDRVNDITR
jgi:hypothetical protein